MDSSWWPQLRQMVAGSSEAEAVVVDAVIIVVPLLRDAYTISQLECQFVH